MGMTASAWVNGGRGATIHWGIVPTSLGEMLVAATAKGVCRLSFDEGREALEERFPAAELVEGGDEYAALLKQVVDAVEAPVNGFDHIPIDVKGTAFQEAVWRELRKIPAGETRSYADIAAAVGKPKAGETVQPTSTQPSTGSAACHWPTGTTPSQVSRAARQVAP